MHLAHRTFEKNIVDSRDVEAVEYFCFRFQLRITLVASEFASSFFLQSASASQKSNLFHRLASASTSLPRVL